MEKPIRSLIKTISWRLLATLITVLLALAFTKDIGISTSIGILELIIKTAVYYLHERAWNLTNFGRKT
ncbi:MAG: DUF2061 domain-containing protein [Candidatus Bathyarchaeia archaeon]|nr:DUF2061 domain-containing protein [Candidatus Bathyarchaeota archaeon A05DMB-4]MDH7595374.1 DUF2061 domain-containing protein [Candidatus Bathyarchaeota archaeon]